MCVNLRHFWWRIVAGGQRARETKSSESASNDVPNGEQKLAGEDPRTTFRVISSLPFLADLDVELCFLKAMLELVVRAD